MDIHVHSPQQYVWRRSRHARTHPLSGRKALFLGIHSSRIEGMDSDEFTALLADLAEHVTREDRVYHHHWRVGDLVMPDSRCVLHRGLADFAGTTQPRILHRTIIKGDKPFRLQVTTPGYQHDQPKS